MPITSLSLMMKEVTHWGCLKWVAEPFYMIFFKTTLLNSTELLYYTSSYFD